MNSVLFAKMDQVFSKGNKTLKKYWKFGKKYWKSQGILSVRKSGNPDKSSREDIKALRVQLIRFTFCMEKNTQDCQPELQLDPITQIFVHPKVRNLALFIWISEVD